MGAGAADTTATVGNKLKIETIFSDIEKHSQVAAKNRAVKSWNCILYSAGVLLVKRVNSGFESVDLQALSRGFGVLGS